MVVKTKATFVSSLVHHHNPRLQINTETWTRGLCDSALVHLVLSRRIRGLAISRLFCREGSGLTTLFLSKKYRCLQRVDHVMSRSTKAHNLSVMSCRAVCTHPLVSNGNGAGERPQPSGQRHIGLRSRQSFHAL